MCKVRQMKSKPIMAPKYIDSLTKRKFADEAIKVGERLRTETQKNIGGLISTLQKEVRNCNKKGVAKSFKEQMIAYSHHGNPYVIGCKLKDIQKCIDKIKEKNEITDIHQDNGLNRRKTYYIKDSILKKAVADSVEKAEAAKKRQNVDKRFRFYTEEEKWEQVKRAEEYLKSKQPKHGPSSTE